MGEYFDKKIIVSGISVTAVAILLSWLFLAGGASWIGSQLGMAPVATPGPSVGGWLYTEGLTANFKVQDATYGVILDDESVSANLYSISANPLTIASLDTSVAVGTYDGFLTTSWSVVADAGSYKMVILDAGDELYYPSIYSVTVPGTNETDNVVNLSPYLFSLKQRADMSLEVDTYAYDTDTGLYVVTDPVDTITLPESGTLRYLIRYTFNVGGLKTYIAAGRVYLPVYTGMTITSATLGADTVAVLSDVDASDDGQIGYYISLADMNGGTTMVLNVYVTVSASASSGTYAMTYVEDYVCMNPDLRWWADATGSVDVVTPD